VWRRVHAYEWSPWYVTVVPCMPCPCLCLCLHVLLSHCVLCELGLPHCAASRH
jgi:hypothetical protein